MKANIQRSTFNVRRSNIGSHQLPITQRNVPLWKPCWSTYYKLGVELNRVMPWRHSLAEVCERFGISSRQERVHRGCRGSREAGVPRAPGFGGGAQSEGGNMSMDHG